MCPLHSEPPSHFPLCPMLPNLNFIGSWIIVLILNVSKLFKLLMQDKWWRSKLSPVFSFPRKYLLSFWGLVHALGVFWCVSSLTAGLVQNHSPFSYCLPECYREGGTDLGNTLPGLCHLQSPAVHVDLIQCNAVLWDSSSEANPRKGLTYDSTLKMVVFSCNFSGFISNISL